MLINDSHYFTEKIRKFRAQLLIIKISNNKTETEDKIIQAGLTKLIVKDLI